MNSRPLFWVIFALAGFLGAVSFTLNRMLAPQGTATGPAGHVPDYVIENFTALHLGANGLPAQTLRSPRMVHYPDDDSADLVAPQALAFDNRARPVSIAARRGRVTEAGDHIVFDGDVVVRRGRPDAADWALARTRRLDYSTPDRTASTDQPVHFQTPTLTATGVGLRLDAVARTLEMGGRVKARYVPPR